jgi:hypothetical protein
VFVFQDDFPLNGEHDGGGGIDVVSPIEPGLGGFNITLFDDAGGTGDATGQMTYDMFNQPLSNSLAGTLDPATRLDACPISKTALTGVDSTNGNALNSPSATGITGTIVTCPKYEADGATLSPLAGQAVVANLMPGRYGVVATPAADRIGRGEEWLQTNTLDGQKAHDSFLRIGGPNFFQEFGPAGYHVTIGFANPEIINGRKAGVCNGTDPNITDPTKNTCTNTVTGLVTIERMSRTPDERLYSSGDNSSFSFTQCYVSLRPEQLPRIRQEALRGWGNGRYPRRGHLRLNPAVRRSVLADPHQLDSQRPGRHHQPLSGGNGPRWQHVAHVGRYHKDQQLGRLGAGLPDRRQSQHELPRSGHHRPVLFHSRKSADVPRHV